jgi:hypothetical protein
MQTSCISTRLWCADLAGIETEVDVGVAFDIRGTSTTVQLDSGTSAKVSDALDLRVITTTSPPGLR